MGAFGGYEMNLSAQATIQQLVAALSQSLTPERTAFVSNLADRSVREIDAYHDVLDQRAKRLLRASIEENVVAILHMLEHDIDPDTLDAPPSAIAYAHRLAQHDVPLSALLRNYRIGQADFLELAMSLAISTDEPAAGPAMKSLVQMVSSYIDNVSEQVTVAYEEERYRWGHRHGALLSQRVLSLLQSTSDELPDDQPPLGYELDQTHLGIVAWLDPSKTVNRTFLDPEQLRATFASTLKTRTMGLAIPRDDREVWLWFGVDRTTPIPATNLWQIADLPMGVRLAIGGKQAGVGGFRRTHHQAQQVKGALLHAQGLNHQVTTFEQLGPVAMMSNDMPAMRSWVGEVLGPLAAVDERSSRLRESLRAFLRHNRSYSAAAAELHVHRNTMLHRVRSAEELLGRDDYDNLNIELALTAVHWLGAAALPQ